MNIIKKIKEWFSPAKQDEGFYIDFRKLRQKELDKDFNMINHDIHLIIKEPPFRWVLHIEKCLEYNELDFAITHLRYWERCCHWANLDYGWKCDLTPLWNKIKDSKQYKQMMMEKKMKRMMEDFQ